MKIVDTAKCRMRFWTMLIPFLILASAPFRPASASTYEIEATTIYKYTYYVSDMHLGYCTYRCESHPLPRYQVYEKRADNGTRQARLSMFIQTSGFDALSRHTGEFRIDTGRSTSSPYYRASEVYDGVDPRYRFDDWELTLKFDDTGDIVSWKGYAVYGDSGDGWSTLSSNKHVSDGFDTYDRLRGYLPRPWSVSSRRGAWVLTEKTQLCYDDRYNRVNCANSPDFIAPVPLPASALLAVFGLGFLGVLRVRRRK